VLKLYTWYKLLFEIKFQYKLLVLSYVYGFYTFINTIISRLICIIITSEFFAEIYIRL